MKKTKRYIRSCKLYNKKKNKSKTKTKKRHYRKILRQRGGEFGELSGNNELLTFKGKKRELINSQYKDRTFIVYYNKDTKIINYIEYYPITINRQTIPRLRSNRKGIIQNILNIKIFNINEKILLLITDDRIRTYNILISNEEYNRKVKDIITVKEIFEKTIEKLKPIQSVDIDQSLVNHSGLWIEDRTNTNTDSNKYVEFAKVKMTKEIGVKDPLANYIPFGRNAIYNNLINLLNKTLITPIRIKIDNDLITIELFDKSETVLLLNYNLEQNQNIPIPEINTKINLINLIKLNINKSNSLDESQSDIATNNFVIIREIIVDSINYKAITYLNITIEILDPNVMEISQKLGFYKDEDIEWSPIWYRTLRKEQ